ncbi:DUF6779 domain-containing protein [Nocardia sp. NPDC052254]|uniref:DUF6779 domain-containing protein n=1 Tax=Nocardia sp. NPDC052254 TaxID=3155681 RepID=UPI00341D0EF0
MVSPSRSSTSSRQRDNAGKIVVGVLILLGLIASVFLVFSDNVQLIRVGLVAALWAAAVAALAATRYRRDAAVDQAKTRDLQKVYELQLEREITARREYELGVESRVRREVGADATELAALRTELTVLRESLQRLFDGDLLVDRPALRAEAVRVQELTHAAVANGSSQETDTWDAWSSPSSPLHVVSPVFDPDHPEPPAFASPYDDPVTAETAVVSAEPSESEDVVDSEVAAETAASEGESSEDGAAEDDDAAMDVESSDDSADGTSESDSDSDGDVEESATAAAASTVPRLAPVQPAATMGTANSRRRRHADADADRPGRKLTVAEIMANLRSEQSGAN